MKKVIIGISGASGVILGVRLLQELKVAGAQTHLIITDQAKEILTLETGYDISDVEKIADYVYNNKDMSASVASGSFLTDGMVVVPCSIKSLSAIAMSFNDTLLVRAADVVLKEKRRLVLCVREMPFHEGHLKLMSTMARRGAVICPPVITFYNNPETIEDICNLFVGKVMDLMGLVHDICKRWNGCKELKVN